MIPSRAARALRGILSAHCIIVSSFAPNKREPRNVRSSLDRIALDAGAATAGAAGVAVTARKGGVQAPVATEFRTVSLKTPRAVATEDFRTFMAFELAPRAAEALGAKFAAVSRDARKERCCGCVFGAVESPYI